jgi:hypothetical protein
MQHAARVATAWDAEASAIAPAARVSTARAARRVDRREARVADAAHPDPVAVVRAGALDDTFDSGFRFTTLSPRSAVARGNGTMTRSLWAAVAVATFAVACDDGAAGSPGIDAGVVDAPSPGRDTMTVDAPPVSAQCAAAIDINAMTLQDGAYIIRGSSVPAARSGGLVAPAGCLATPGAEFVHQTLYRYRMRTRGRLFASTMRPGTDAMLDTAVVIADACSSVATTLACNDNRVAAPGVAGSIQSVARTATELEAGTTVFISVGSASPPAAGNREQSNYELLVFELAAVPEGGVCTTSDQCDANGLCFVETGAPSGICRITGREGGYCRPEANCDPGYICRGQNETQGTLGTCIREVPAGGDCGGFYTRCVADSSCRSDPTNVGRYLCVGAGVQGGICRRAGAACDSGLMCIGGFCRTQSNAAQPCDPANFRTACVVAGQTCIGIAQPGSGICGPAVPEVEPNNTPSAPMPAPVTFSTVFTGSLAMMDDVDCFRFTVAEGTSIIAETHENNGLCAETTSTILTLHGPDGAPLVTEEDSGNDWCSLIDGMRTTPSGARNPAGRLRAGTYSLCVANADLPPGAPRTLQPIARYFLSLRFIPPT